MKKTKIILVALAPFYEGSVLWVEQLFDFLNVFADGIVFLPHVTLNEQVRIEYNKIVPLLGDQYSNVSYYSANANIRDVSGYQQACAQALAKIKSYFTFDDDRVLLEHFNDKVYWALGRQYELLLSPEFQATFHALQQGLIASLGSQLKTTAQDALIITSIEHAAVLQDYLSGMFEQRIFIYGEDFLTDET